MTEVQLHVETPLVHSAPLSQVAGRPVYLKMENCQPSGSFKLRGIGNSCRIAVKSGATHLVCSSGGNAGMATAYAAKCLGVKATIFTMSGLPQPVLKKFHDLGSEIFVGGPIWDECDRTARKYMAELESEGKKTHYIHPFNSLVTWEGHSTLILEVERQLLLAGHPAPGAVVTCVGGGGLLAGISRGMSAVSWDHVPIIAMETWGAESFHRAVEAGKPVKIPGITSVCKTLGAQIVCEEVVRIFKTRKIISKVTDDQTAVRCALLMLRDHQMLVEPACGATLSPIYTGKLGEYLGETCPGTSPIIAVVCGGATVDVTTLNKLASDLEVDTSLEQVYSIPEMKIT